MLQKIVLGPRRATGLTAPRRASYGLRKEVCFDRAFSEPGDVQKNTGMCSVPKM